MRTIQAVVAEPHLPGRLALREIEPPASAPCEAVVRQGNRIMMPLIYVDEHLEGDATIRLIGAS